MQHHMYILDGNQVVPTDDIEEWSAFMKTAQRFLKRHELKNITVSSVFLGMNHGFSWEEHGVPILFETMVYVGRYHDMYIQRYSTMPECMYNHYRILAQAVFVETSVYSPHSSEMFLKPSSTPFSEMQMRHHIYPAQPTHIIAGEKG